MRVPEPLRARQFIWSPKKCVTKRDAGLVAGQQQEYVRLKHDVHRERSTKQQFMQFFLFHKLLQRNQTQEGNCGEGCVASFKNCVGLLAILYTDTDV